MITIYGIGSHISYEETGALELLRSQGVHIQSILPPTASEADLHLAQATLSRFYVNCSVYKTGDFEQAGLVVSFGRPEIFELIRKTGDRPKKMVYGLPEVTATSAEVKALADGFIDEIFTQSQKRAFQTVADLVKRAQRGVEHRAGYTPFCNPLSEFNQLKFAEAKNPQKFTVLTETPDAPDYCFPNHWAMVCGVTTPLEKTKNVHALNWGKALTKKAGNPGNSNSKWHGEVEASLTHRPPTIEERKDAYAEASVLLHFYPADDVFCFSAARAILSGAVVVGSPLPAFVDLINHGETGFIARSADEAAYFTSRVAWEPHLRAKLAANAYNWFTSKGPGNPDNCSPWWEPLIKWT